MLRARLEREPRIWALGLLVLMVVGLLIAAKPAHADTFTVTNAADPGDGFCNAQGCTLREAIGVANASQGADTIKFNIPVQAVHTISPTSELPTITEAVVIDGNTQPGSKPNSRQSGAIDAVILIELSGVNIGQVRTDCE
jgi:CSLREA domain-containing protein